jgi:glycerol-3-phosphate acyltransferase PlsX
VSAPQKRPIALDLSGGDGGAELVYKAAALALDQGAGPLLLVGTRDEISAVPRDLRDRVELLEASETIEMSDSPARAARSKKQSTMHLGMRAIKDGEACAFVTAGNSGAALAVALMTLKRLKGCDRPAIASLLPTARSHITLLDLGANTEVRPAQYAQFAVLGEAYSRVTTGLERPRVALLSNGVELTKGTEALRTAHQLLSITDLNYLGFVEANAIPLGQCDVVVTDGFTGNVSLKLTEGIIEGLKQRLSDHLMKSWRGRLLAPLLRSALRSFGAEVDWRKVGGAPILGVNGLVMVSHGRSDEVALCSAICRARESVDVNLINELSVALESTPYTGRVSSTSELVVFPPQSGEV